MTYDEWLATLLPFEAKALTRREIFQAGAASRDAEVVSLTNQRDYEYVRAENAEQERDQLREQVKMLREVVNDALSGMGGGYAIWSPRAQEALAATEQNP